MADAGKQGSVWYPKTNGAARRWPSGRVRYRGKVIWPDGKRQDFAVEEINCASEAIAAERVAEIQAEIDTAGATALADAMGRAAPASSGAAPETCDAWFARYLPSMECGENHRRIVGHTWNKWIAKVLGTKPIATLTRDDVEDVRDALDRAVDAKTIRAATARNAWSVLTGALKAAYASRDRSLRVHATPLNFGLLPPKGGDSRQRPWVYPNEWRALVACEAVPVEWRQLYATALYTGLRPNELRALTWDDVDTTARQISVSKAWDEQTKTAKPPKTGAGRRMVPIEPQLLPLLDAMRGDAGGAELVAPLLSWFEDRAAGLLRTDLSIAEVSRSRLTADNETEEPVDFRSLRDSYATWLALAGVPDKRIQRRLGHKSNTTTDGYIKAAESFDVDAIGEPFPALPSELLVSTPDVYRNEKTPVSRGFLVARVGFERSRRAPSLFSHRVSEAIAPPPPETSGARRGPNVAKARRVDTGVDMAPEELAPLAALARRRTR